MTALLIFAAAAFCGASLAQNPSSPAPSGFPLGPPAKILSFTAEPDSIQPGQSVKLTWVVINADRIEVEPGMGVVATRASRSVTPATSTVYVLKAVGRGGADRRALTVTVAGTALPSEPVGTEADPLANKPIPRTADGHPDLAGIYIGGFDIRPTGPNLRREQSQLQGAVEERQKVAFPAARVYALLRSLRKPGRFVSVPTRFSRPLTTSHSETLCNFT